MHLLDTPGVLPPKIESVETGLKLALCGQLQHICGGDFLLKYFGRKLYFLKLHYYFNE